MLEQKPPLRQSEENRYVEILGLTWDELKGKHILDIGAGSGSFARAARQRNVDVVSLDINTRRWSKGENDLHQTPLVLADMEHLPLRPESFDLVVSVAVPPHDDEQAANILEEIFAVLKKGGEYRSTTNYSSDVLESMSKQVGFSTFSYEDVQEPWYGRYFILKK